MLIESKVDFYKCSQVANYKDRLHELYVYIGILENPNWINVIFQNRHFIVFKLYLKTRSNKHIWESYRTRDNNETRVFLNFLWSKKHVFISKKIILISEQCGTLRYNFINLRFPKLLLVDIITGYNTIFVGYTLFDVLQRADKKH